MRTRSRDHGRDSRRPFPGRASPRFLVPAFIWPRKPLRVPSSRTTAATALQPPRRVTIVAQKPCATVAKPNRRAEPCRPPHRIHLDSRSVSESPISTPTLYVAGNRKAGSSGELKTPWRFRTPGALRTALTTLVPSQADHEPTRGVQAPGEPPQNPLRERCPCSAAGQRRRRLHPAIFFR